MSDDTDHAPAIADFETIEAAVMETARGRWFLAEHARRTRAQETDRLLQAIAQLAARPGGPPERIERAYRDGLAELQRALARTRTEIAASLPVRAEPLESVLKSLDLASAAILDAAVGVHEVAWRLREDGASPSLCEAVERHATEIYDACAGHGRGVQGTARLVRLVRLFEERIASLLGQERGEPEQPAVLPAAPARAVPVEAAIPGDDRSSAIPPAQSLETAAPLEPRAAAGFAEPQAGPVRRSVLDRMAALAEIDALDTREKLRRFT